ncbi:DUF2147 domain-containing protein [Aestuariispira insulae]|uniref:Uncharacterized protein (DUF2147 family) n=1 Tax=Aestuariispira insulae TaxID=1461337 RepID=A0A3D9HRM7_9PROT|nr:DUF2147 domain-containing protein [Aestuariispira insulae]RED52164.1 uncharacterized protein (DUF2147 family) [Aestuariispira insulae]
MKRKSRANALEQTALIMGLGTLIGVAAAILMMGMTDARADDSAVFGTWETKDGKSHVKIENCEDGICGKIVWLKEPTTEDGQPKLDRLNKDDKLKTRPLLGLTMLNGFVPGDDNNHFDDGTIYNPSDGNSYSSEMALLEDGNLKVEGCVLFICKEQIWTRVP